ncbi:hypothetical protein [Enterobacter phage 04_vB_Eclo_IJM]|nr:hypothetical protein [Enterobacter phage 04_vB_Eclo_IJM]
MEAVYESRRIGRELKAGQKVAFCLAGKSFAMRIGEVVRVMPKTVAIRHETFIRWKGVTEEVETVRAFSSVCIIEEA